MKQMPQPEYTTMPYQNATASTSSYTLPFTLGNDYAQHVNYDNNNNNNNTQTQLTSLDVSQNTPGTNESALVRKAKCRK